MKIKLNIPLAGYQKGQTISIDADSKGTPIDKFWRRRLKDAEIDNCVEVVKAPSEIKKGKAK